MKHPFLKIAVPLLILAATPFAPAHALKQSQYKMAQQTLTELGYYKGPVDGKWSDEALVALNKFQEDNDFEQTKKLTRGFVGVLKTISEGGTRDYVPISERIGNTLFVSSGERIYFKPDGSKIIQLKNGRSYNRSWRKLENGAYCETLFDRTEFCEGQSESKYIILKVKKKTRWFKPSGKRVWTMVLKEGRRLRR
jgi:Putative peptidoglycan binding domain